MRIIPRSEWGARYSDGFRPAPLPASEVWLHHSVTAPGSGTLAGDKAAVRALETIGQQRFGGGISYTWLVTPAGRIFTGHSPGRQGAHTGGRNDIARAICLIGNYDTTAPTGKQLDAVVWLLGQAERRGWTRHALLNGGHRDAPGAATVCPGRHAWALIPEINQRAAGGAGGGGGDMSWSEKLTGTDPDYDGDGTAPSSSTTAGAWLVRMGWRIERLRNVLLPRLADDVGQLHAKLDAQTRAIANLLERPATGLTEQQVRQIVREETAGRIYLTPTREDPS